jgi:Spy/CpxP family protein refolding chaperone
MIAAARQRARRALRRLAVTEAQAEQARRLLREQRRRLEAVQALLSECRRELRAALSAAAPDSTLVLELSVQERLLVQKERAACAQLERSLATVLLPEQAKRLHGLAPAAVGDLLQRICG